MKTERRRHERIVLPPEKMLDCEGVSRPLAGKILVLGTGGMYILTTNRYPLGTELELRIRAEAETLEAPGVVRDAESGGLGIEFTWLSGPTEIKLRKLIARLKS